MYLFGSIASSKDNEYSDVDLACLFDQDLPRRDYAARSLVIMDELSGRLDKNVDIVALNQASSFLKFQIMRDGLRVYERVGRTKRNFEARAIMEYFDFLPVKRRMETALINSIKEA